MSILLKTKNFSLEKVNNSKPHIDLLFKLLKQRKIANNISHSKIPSYAEHKKFVFSNPYRYWFIIKDKNECKGTVFITINNEISIKLIQYKDILFIEILNIILKNIKSLKAIPSRRNSNFIFNVSPYNKEIIKVLKKMKCKKIQETYKIITEKL